jgi:hypothetical protein
MKDTGNEITFRYRVASQQGSENRSAIQMLLKPKLDQSEQMYKKYKISPVRIRNLHFFPAYTRSQILLPNISIDDEKHAYSEHATLFVLLSLFTHGILAISSSSSLVLLLPPAYVAIVFLPSSCLHAIYYHVLPSSDILCSSSSSRSRSSSSSFLHPPPTMKDARKIDELKTIATFVCKT